MQENLIPISLPFRGERHPKGASVRVFVLPDKVYGKFRGTSLIERYGDGAVNRSINSTSKNLHEYIHWTQDDNLWTFNTILKGFTERIFNLSKPTDTAQIKTLFFPPGKLKEDVEVGNQHFNLRDIVYCVEDILNTKILCRYDNRVVKTMINSSVEVTLQPTDKGIIIFGKKGYSYLLRKNES